MRRFPTSALIAFGESVLGALGSRSEEAHAVARHLVDANRAGHDSHGVALLPTYARHVRAGAAKPNAAVRVTRQAGAILQIDGDRGFGAVVGAQAVTQACAIARDSGVCALTIAGSHHLGRIGAFGEMAADDGLAFIAFVNVVDHGGLVAPYRGTDARFGTNPICIALPAADAHPAFLLDYATSRLALGKVREAAAKGEPVPFGSVLDARGAPSDDPTGMGSHDYAAHVGALAFFGEHKGYALGFAAELLAGLLSGYGTLQPGAPRLGGIINTMFAIVVDPARFADPAWIRREQDAMMAYALASPPANPDAPVLAPGDFERAARADRDAHGAPLSDGVIGHLRALGGELGVSTALFDA